MMCAGRQCGVLRFGGNGRMLLVLLSWQRISEGFRHFVLPVVTDVPFVWLMLVDGKEYRGVDTTDKVTMAKSAC